MSYLYGTNNLAARERKIVIKYKITLILFYVVIQYTISYFVGPLISEQHSQLLINVNVHSDKKISVKNKLIEKKDKETITTKKTVDKKNRYENDDHENQSSNSNTNRTINAVKNLFISIKI